MRLRIGLDMRNISPAVTGAGSLHLSKYKQNGNSYMKSIPKSEACLKEIGLQYVADVLEGAGKLGSRPALRKHLRSGAP